MNVNVTADAVGKVGKNDWIFAGCGGRGGWMVGWKQRDVTFFGSWVLIRCYLSREADFGRDLGRWG